VRVQIILAVTHHLAMVTRTH